MLDTNDNTTVSQRKQIRIGSQDVSFLLADLVAKLKQSFHAPKAVPWAGQSNTTAGFDCLLQRSDNAIMAWLIGMLPCLCGHLESSCAFFQEILEEYDGVNDIAIIEKWPGFLEADQCFRQLLQILSSAVSWPGFGRSEERHLLWEFLGVLADRTDPSSQRGHGQLLLDSFR